MNARVKPLEGREASEGRILQVSLEVGGGDLLLLEDDEGELREEGANGGEEGWAIDNGVIVCKTPIFALL